MGVTTEEAKAKLSLDTTDLERGRQSIDRFGQESHKSFLHAGSAARSFHKVMEEVTNISPVMGRALQISIAPIAGTFAAAAAGLGIANEKLKEFNHHLDEMANKAARPITNAGAASESAQKRVGDVLNQMGAFEQGQRAKVPVLSGLSEMQNIVLSGMTPGPQRDAMERSFVGSAISRVWAEAVRIERQRISAAGSAASPDRQKALSRARDLANSLHREIDEAQSNLGVTQSRAATPLAGIAGLSPADILRGTILVGTGRDIGDIALEDKKRHAADASLTLLQKQKEELRKVEEQIKKLTAEDEKSVKALKDKQEALGRIIDSLRELEKEYSKIPPAAPPPVPGMPMTIDPATGGVPLHALPNLGGIPYRPIRGAPGYMPIISTPPANLAQTDPIVLLNIKMQKLVDAATDSGIILRLPE